MPWHPWEEIINHETLDEILHRIVQAAEGHSDSNYVRAAGDAKAELARREQENRSSELVVQLNSQKELIERQILATRELSEQQAKNSTALADKQIKTSKIAAYAAWGAALATFCLIGVGYVQWDEMKNARMTMEKTLLSSQRAWLAPGGVQIYDEFAPNTYQEVRLSYGNLGKEPALKINQLITAITLPREHIRDTAATRAAIAKATGGIECRSLRPDPNGHIAHPSGPRVYSVRVGVKAEQVNEIVSRESYLLVAGCFAYESFGTDHHSGFCRFFDFNTGESSLEWPSSICFVPEYAD